MYDIVAFGFAIVGLGFASVLLAYAIVGVLGLNTSRKKSKS